LFFEAGFFRQFEEKVEGAFVDAILGVIENEASSSQPRVGSPAKSSLRCILLISR
jgi:hypothetical protein